MFKRVKRTWRRFPGFIGILAAAGLIMVVHAYTTATLEADAEALVVGDAESLNAQLSIVTFAPDIPEPEPMLPLFFQMLSAGEGGENGPQGLLLEQPPAPPALDHL